MSRASTTKRVRERTSCHALHMLLATECGAQLSEHWVWSTLSLWAKRNDLKLLPQMGTRRVQIKKNKIKDKDKENNTKSNKRYLPPRQLPLLLLLLRGHWLCGTSGKFCELGGIWWCHVCVSVWGVCPEHYIAIYVVCSLTHFEYNRFVYSFPSDDQRFLISPLFFSMLQSSFHSNRNFV